MKMDKVKDHIVVVVCCVFAAGAGTAWKVLNELMVIPRDDQIERLEKVQSDERVELHAAKSRSESLDFQLNQCRGEVSFLSARLASQTRQVGQEESTTPLDTRAVQSNDAFPSHQEEPPLAEMPLRFRLEVEKLRVVEDCQGGSFFGLKGEYTYSFDVAGQWTASTSSREAQERNRNDEILIGESTILMVSRRGESVIPIQASVSEFNKTKGVLNTVEEKSFDLTFDSGQLTSVVAPLVFRQRKGCEVELWFSLEEIPQNPAAQADG